MSEINQKDLEDRLRQTFNDVRETFFPKWDRKRNWQIVLDLNHPAAGRCDTEGKRIMVSAVGKDSDGLDCLLIHEIAHAAACTGHGKRFQARLLKAADCADELGRDELARLIREDVRPYQEENHIYRGAKDIYAKIGEWVWDTKGEATYESIVGSLATELGCYLEELEKTYKRCRSVYEKAVEEYRRFAKEQEKLKQRLKELESKRG